MTAAVGVAGIITRREAVLVLRRSQEDHFLPGAWDLPGGGIAPGEPPEEGIVREVLEETGLRTTVVRTLGSKSYLLNPDSGKKDKLMIVYLLKVTKETGVRLSDEHDEFRWVTNAELDDIFQPGDLMREVLSGYFAEGSDSRT